jgi:hypothetical protein
VQLISDYQNEAVLVSELKCLEKLLESGREGSMFGLNMMKEQFIANGGDDLLLQISSL